jgi:hypothetical protein
MDRMRRQYPLRVTLALGLVSTVGSCGSPAASSSGFAAGGIGDAGSTATTNAATTDTTTTGSSSSSTSSTTSTGSADGSTTASGPDDTSTTTPPPDFGAAGCAGKVDLLFVLSSQYTMEPVAKQMKAALPAFIDTIRTRFADFDTQILVTDANGRWSAAACIDCVISCKDGPPDYPCLYWSELDECDDVEGAGGTFPVGWGTQNKRCEVAGGHRYVLASDPNFEETFLCLASVGYSGGTNAPVQVMLKALSDDLTGPEGCNAGFLRDDALLVVVVIADTYELSDGVPIGWKTELLQAKGDDPDAVVLLAITTDIDLEQHLCLLWEDTNPKENPLRTFVNLMPHGLIGSICAPSWGPFFEQAADLVVDQCQVFVPQ